MFTKNGLGLNHKSQTQRERKVTIPPFLKKTPVLIGAGVVVLIIILAMRKSQSAQTSSTGGSDDYASRMAATQAANVQIAGLNAEVQKAAITGNTEITLGSYSKDVSLANIQAQQNVAAAKITSDENVNLAGLDYSHDIANRQLENNRILGLTGEDTKRLLSTQENQTRLTLGVTAIDAQRFIAERTLSSEEVQQARELQLRQSELESNERIADWTTTRALTYAQITGANQVAAVKAAKPSNLQTFLGGIGGALGGAASLAKVFV